MAERIRPERRLHLAVNVLAGGIDWRLPGGFPTAFFDPTFYANAAQIAERGLLDAVFMADNSVLHAKGYPNSGLDPVVTLATMAQATSKIGLVASYSTTFHEPYSIARVFVSLDHLSNGRAGWNMVTSRNKPEGLNYGFTELPSRHARYQRAVEAAEIVTQLWDSWQPGALILDTASGVALDRTLIKPIDYVGEYLSCTGPLQLPPSRQGRPLLTQAGGSDDGIELAARFADGVFTSSLYVEQAREYYTKLKTAAARYGRSPGQIAVLPGIALVIGSTESEARQRAAEHEALSGVPTGDPVEQWARTVGVNLHDLDPDKPFPLELLKPTGDTYSSVGFDTSTRLYLEHNHDLTVRELAARGSPGAHRRIVGSPEQIADDFEEWFTTGAADGFVLMLDSLPSGLELFVDHVIPVLQNRGLFRREYAEDTLRERFGAPYLRGTSSRH
jgi:FMN-dependent oxidoreductase (nitrilotriacetate monooxygenase family)